MGINKPQEEKRESSAPESQATDPGEYDKGGGIVSSKTPSSQGHIIADMGGSLHQEGTVGECLGDRFGSRLEGGHESINPGNNGVFDRGASPQFAPTS